MTRRVAVVTGASSGIGAATAQALGARGWTVVLVARRRAALDRVAGCVQTAGGRAVVEALDAADAAAVAAMAGRVVDQHGTPALIVNAAGAGAWQWPEDTPPAAMEAMLDAPYRAAYHVTQAFLPDLLAQRSGTLIHIGSPAALMPWPGATGYTVSRWALRGLHESLRQDLAGTGVVSCHVIFAEVATEYFAVNAGARERRPAIGRIVPVATAPECAEVILRTLDRPRPQVLHPPLLRALALIHHLAPAVTRWLLRVTGARRARVAGAGRGAAAGRAGRPPGTRGPHRLGSGRVARRRRPGSTRATIRTRR